MPFMPGIDKSDNTRSKSAGAALKAERASSERVKADTRCPRCSSMRFISTASGSSSSRYRMLFFIPCHELRIRQALEEGNQVRTLPRIQGECVQRGMSFLGGDVSATPHALIMSHYRLERRESSVVHVGRRHRDIPQCRNSQRCGRGAVGRKARFAGSARRIAPISGEVESRMAGRAAEPVGIEERHAALFGVRKRRVLPAEDVSVEAGMAGNQRAFE